MLQVCLALLNEEKIFLKTFSEFLKKIMGKGYRGANFNLVMKFFSALSRLYVWSGIECIRVNT